MKNKLTFYHYLYYKLYKFSKRTEKQWGKNMQMPEWAAFIVQAILFFFNLLIVIIFLIKMNIMIDDWQIIFPCIVALSLNFYLFIYKQKYIIIESYFDNIDFQLIPKMNFYFWTYIVLTIVSLISCLIFIKPST